MKCIDITKGCFTSPEGVFRGLPMIADLFQAL